MSEYTSYKWDFTRVPRFFVDWNKKFDIELMTATSNNFQFVFSDYAPTNISDCLTANGTLSSEVNVLYSLDCALKRNEECTTISVANEVTWNIGTAIHPVKAVFLKQKSTNYVLGYCIHQNSIEVTNKVIVPTDTILWSFQNAE